jgi:glycerol-3-phosphate acyltransferase PlsY
MIETLGLVPWESADTYYYLAATLALSYLAGSIPFGLIFGWLAGAGDVRKIGSGNIGATNVLRTGKRWAAAATLFFDAAKGWLSVMGASAYFGIEIFPVAAGFGAFLGHLFPVWLRFKGGKGFATYIGITVALAWPVAALTCATWLATARSFRYSSLAALVAGAMTPVYLFLWGTTLFAALGAVLALLIFFSHRSNIVRLLNGTESKIGAK